MSDERECRVEKSDREWKDSLSAESYNILRKKGTERPFSGVYNNHKGEGIYVCAGCSNPLFESGRKFDSGTGWPSFDSAVEGNVDEEQDRSHGMLRKEIKCSRCGGHLGHVFDDGPTSTTLRYCTNSASLQFKEK